jgi:hypothetical protein
VIDLFALFHPHPSVETAVRATLSDGQVLMGEVETRILRMVTGAGLVDVPLADIGEVLPASAGGLQASEGQVSVWLRNGSELRGTWSDPRLGMAIAVGGNRVPIDLPMNELTRFQLKGEATWPAGPVYRMKTSWGDDLLVDGARTRLVVENQLGSFEPSLAECQYVAPVGDPEGDWRIALSTGTVLIGKLHDAAVTVSLPMGPESLTVPLKNFVSLKLESWGPPPGPPAYAPPMYVEPARDEEDSLRRDGAPLSQRTHEDAPSGLDHGPPPPGAGPSSGRAYSAGAKSVVAPPAASQAAPEWFDSAPMREAKGE